MVCQVNSHYNQDISAFLMEVFTHPENKFLKLSMTSKSVCEFIWIIYKLQVAYLVLSITY